MDFIFSRISGNSEQSFSLKESSLYHGLNDLHDHNEVELIYVIEGKGTIMIHEKIEQIVGETMIMIGSNVPHMLRFESFAYLKPLTKMGKYELPVRLLTLHFNPQTFGNTFMALPENYLINQLFSDCLNGLVIHPDEHPEVLARLKELMTAPKYDHLPLLMRLFNGIALSQQHTSFTSTPSTNNYNKLDEQRLTKIYLYTLNNFTKTIKLKDVAAIIYMSPNAFCKYFRNLTQKSYFEFLLEVKINYACRLLKETDYSMVVVCYDSGFSNHSNFNRHFKKITGQTPLEYRKTNQHSITGGL